MSGIIKILPRKNHPRYEHDCDECQYLGTFASGADNRDEDWYVCMSGHGGLVARYGDDGPDYRHMYMGEMAWRMRRFRNQPSRESLPTLEELLQR